MQKIKIDNIKPASYNPRIISEEQFDKLCESVNELGFIIPILVNSQNNTIIAGHQRTKAAKAVGIQEVPVYMVKGVNKGDEIKFNQLHNAVDVHNRTNVIYKGEYDEIGFVDLCAEDFTLKENNAEYTQEMCKLILKYGNVLCAVICDKEVLIGGNYVKACKLLNIPVHTSVIDSTKLNMAKEYLHGSYGEYSYKNIPKETYVQGLAQMNRQVNREDGGKANKSSLYVNYVIPYLAKHKNLTVLDFGCGKGAYVKSLSKTIDIIGVEFYNHNNKSIDITKGNKMIDALISKVEKNGRFDLVVCDSVLNSVDCPEAEMNVLRCLNIFAKDKIFLSGRPLDEIVKKIGFKKSSSPKKRYIQFLDENNFSGIFRAGKWYYQHFHTKEQITNVLSKAGFVVDKMTWMVYGSSWQVEAHKIRELTAEEIMEAINYEFNLPLPNGKSYNRQRDILPICLTL